MPKLFWVALPLLAALAALGWQWLRGRPPGRRALNLGASLLLLAYVATTAALGIFWVARQQLPVFDWHYLFGYATVLLLALHLWFNFGAVWRWLTRPPARRPAPAPPGPGRRRLLRAGGVLAGGSAAYLLGLRQGREEAGQSAAAQDAAGPGLSGDSALAQVERFHAQSAHSRRGLLTQAPPVSWGEAPPPFKRYPQAPRLALPPPRAPARWPGAAALGVALWHVAGVTAPRAGLNLRASPSSGALFPTELYVIARAVPGLESGAWHYDARGHALEQLPRPAAGAALWELLETSA